MSFQADEDTKRRTVYVGNISYSTTEDTLRDEFGKFGRVTHVQIPRFRDTNKVRGFAFVEFEREDDAHASIKDLDGTELDGRRIQVEQSGRPRRQRSPPPRYGGGGGGGNRYDPYRNDRYPPRDYDRYPPRDYNDRGRDYDRYPPRDYDRYPPRDYNGRGRDYDRHPPRDYDDRINRDHDRHPPRDYDDRMSRDHDRHPPRDYNRPPPDYGHPPREYGDYSRGRSPSRRDYGGSDDRRRSHTPPPARYDDHGQPPPPLPGDRYAGNGSSRGGHSSPH